MRGLKSFVALSILVGLVAAVLIAACSNPVSAPATKGSLTITVGNSINARTLTPAISMDAASFSITGTGPNGASFNQSITGGAVTVNNLAFGSWTIIVNATNASGNLIGTGTAISQVNTGTTTPVAVTVTPVSGTGTLSLGVTWPAAQVQSPALVASLTPALGAAQNLAFTISGGSASYSNTAVGNGYYTLAFTLQDNGIVVAGAVDVVRIVTGQTTNGSYAFANVNQATGNIQVNITANLQNPLNVAISGGAATMTAGTTQSLSASVSNNSGNIVYVWYVNGVAVGTGANYAFGTGVNPGYYRIDVTALTADGAHAGSASQLITVTPAITPTNGGVVTTLAGSGIAGYANGNGTAASFYNPSGVAVDSSGNVYVADTNNCMIRKITPAGEVSVLAGSTRSGSVNGTGSAASFNRPTGVAVDSTGTVYVADRENNLIRKITPSGEVSTLAGSGTQGRINGTGIAASFYAPTGIAVDLAGNIYVTDQLNNQIRKITPAGVVSTLAGSANVGSADGTGTTASFNRPIGITVDSVGNVFIADYFNNMIRKITPVGVVTTIAGSTIGGSTDGIGTAASFYGPAGITVDTVGNIFVADFTYHLIRKIDTNAKVTTLAGSGIRGSNNGTGISASFYHPDSVAVDSVGTIYVADYDNQLIRKIK